MGDQLRIAVLASANLQFVPADLRRELERAGVASEVWVAGFNQYRQEIANPGSQLYQQNPQLVILQLDAQDLFMDLLRNPLAVGPGEAAVASRAAEATADAIGAIQAELPGVTVILNTVHLPPVRATTGLEYHSPHGIADLTRAYNAQLAVNCRALPNVLVMDEAALVLRLGYDRWHDPRLWYLARCRLSRTAMRSMAHAYADLIRAWRGQVRKCVVLDLDNTLWGGIAGEEGVEGVALGEEGVGLAFAEFQEELLHLTRKGILLALCSKNNPDDALAVIRQHPSMRLRESDFVAARINWQDKAQNIRELAAELRLGLDSFIFIDDNPAERSHVETELPSVLVPAWPTDPASYKTTLLDLAARHLLRLRLTEEDSRRTAMYHAEGERLALQTRSGSLEDYYRSLEMRATIAVADPFTIPRVAQLTQKTNQFNLTTRRYTEADIRAMASSESHIVLSMAVTDRFAANGIVGVLVLEEVLPGCWEIDTLLLSCRVIGRTVERALLGMGCRFLADRGAAELVGVVVPTDRNAVCRDVYQELGFVPLDGPSPDGASRWRLPLTEQSIAVPDWIAIESPLKELHHA